MKRNVMPSSRHHRTRVRRWRPPVRVRPRHPAASSSSSARRVRRPVRRSTLRFRCPRPAPVVGKGSAREGSSRVRRVPARRPGSSSSSSSRSSSSSSSSSSSFDAGSVSSSGSLSSGRGGQAGDLTGQGRPQTRRNPPASTVLGRSANRFADRSVRVAVMWRARPGTAVTRARRRAPVSP